MAKNTKTPVTTNEEIKEEKKEASLEEAPKNEEEVKPSKKNDKDVEETCDLDRSLSSEDIYDQIEMKRRALLSVFNKTKLISRIAMIVVVAAVIGAIIMIFNDNPALKIAGYSTAGAVLVAMLVYYVITKDRFPKTSKEYITTVTNLINSYDFTDKRFTDLKIHPNKKLTKTELEVDRVYKNASEIGSRNYISGKFDGHEFQVSENVLYAYSAEKKNQRNVAFLGKYITLNNEKRFEGRYIFNIKGVSEKLVDQPNDIDDLKLVLEEDNLQVYAPNEKPVKEVFGTKFMSALKNIKTDNKLLNFVLVVWAGHTAIYLSYDDAVTVLPFEHEFNKEAQDKYKEDLIAALELATLKK